MGWSVHVEAAGDGDPTGDLERLVDMFEVVDGAVAVMPGRFSVTFSIDRAITASTAARDGIKVYRRLVAESTVAAWPVVRLEVLTFAEHDRALDEPAIPQLVGVAEVAELLGVSRQRASQLHRERRPGFPVPVVELASGPVWTRAGVVEFVRGWDRRPGRPVLAQTEPTRSPGGARGSA